MAKRNQLTRYTPKYYTGEIFHHLTMRDLKKRFNTKTQAEDYEKRVNKRIEG